VSIKHTSCAAMILDFGKYKGIDMQEVPLDYMIFLAGYRMQYTQRIATDLPAYDWVKTNKSEFCEFATNYLKTRCWHCEGQLVPVGNSRCNGAVHEDWEERYLHKACWKLLKTRERDK